MNYSFKQVVKFIYETIKTAAIMVIIAFVIKGYLIQTFVIDGSSMEPNFHNHEYLLIDKISYRFSPPKRDEVVVFKPNENTDSYIKRVIGLPGETVKIADGKIYINNRILNEPYLSPGTKTENSRGSLKSRSYKLGKDEYFVLGDNRFNSRDSRMIGAIHFNQIEGRVFVIFYPFSGFRMI